MLLYILKGTGTATNPELTCFEADGYEREEESEVFSENQSFTAHRSSYRRSRRRSSHSEKDRDDPEEDMYIDDEQVLVTIFIFIVCPAANFVTYHLYQQVRPRLVRTKHPT